MSNTITIELCKEDRQRIDALTSIGSLIAAALGAKPFPAGVPDFVQEPAQEPTAPQEVDHPADIVAPHGLPEPAAVRETFAGRLREAMDAAGMKQADLVRETGLDKGAVSSYLAGKYEPKQDAVVALAKCLNVSVLWLMGYEPEPAAEPEQPKYTKADILAKVQKLAHPGNPKRAQAKTIVQSYAGKVSDIPEDKYDEVMAKLTALEEG